MASGPRAPRLPAVAPRPIPATGVPAAPAAAATGDDPWWRGARWAIVGVAAVVYIVLAIPVRGFQTTDYVANYVPTAAGFLQGEGVLAMKNDLAHGPVPGLVLALALLMTGGSALLASHLLSWVSAVVVLACLGAVFARAWGERCAAWTVGLLAISPHFVRFAVVDGVDIQLTAVGAASLASGFLLGGLGGWIAAGLLTGVALGIKQSAMWLIAWGAVAVWLAPGDASPRRRAAWLAAFLAAAYLLAAVWISFNVRVHGDASFNTRAASLHQSLFPPGATIDGASVGDVMAAAPARFVLLASLRPLANLWPMTSVLLASHVLTALALAALAMMLIAGRLSRLQWGVVAFFALHFAVNSLAGPRPRFTFIFLALLLLAAVEAVRRLLWVSRPVAGNAVLALLALFLGAKAIALHIRDVAQIAELNAPARVLTEWFRERGDAEGQAIHVHPHDPVRATLGRGAGPAPVAAWYRLSRDAWVDQVPLGSWVFYNPRFDSDGRFARALTENLPEGWSEVTVPGLAPARLFLCGPDAEMRGRPGIGLAGLPSADAGRGLVSLTLRNTGDEPASAVIALRQRVMDVFHEQRVSARPYNGPDDVTLRYVVPTVIGDIDLLRAETPVIAPGASLDVTLPVPPAYESAPVTLVLNPWRWKSRAHSSWDLGVFPGEELFEAFSGRPPLCVLLAEETRAATSALAAAQASDAAGQAQAWGEFARERWAARDALLALVAARRSAEADPRSTLALGTLGQAAQELHSRTRHAPLRAEAEQAFRRLFELNRGQVWAALRVAALMSEDGRWAEIITLLGPIAERPGVSSELHFRLAEAFESAGAIPAAVERYERFLARLAEENRTDRREALARERLAALRAPGTSSPEAVNLP